MLHCGCAFRISYSFVASASDLSAFALCSAGSFGFDTIASSRATCASDLVNCIARDVVDGGFAIVPLWTLNIDRVEHCCEEAWYDELQLSVAASFTKSNRVLKKDFQET